VLLPKQCCIATLNKRGAKNRRKDLPVRDQEGRDKRATAGD
jgi:hypothetical protein